MRADNSSDGSERRCPLNALLPLAFVLGYLLGSIPFGLILTRLAGTQDLRSIGSGNIGATNVLRTGRKGLAAATLLCDMLKGTVAVIIAGYFGGPERRDAGGARRLSRPSVSGVAEIQRRQRRRGLYRRADRAVLAGGGGVLRDVARTAVISRYSSLSALVASFVTPIFLWWFGHPALASLFAVLTCCCSTCTATTSSGCWRAPKARSGRRQ